MFPSRAVVVYVTVTVINPFAATFSFTPGASRGTIVIPALSALEVDVPRGAGSVSGELLGVGTDWGAGAAKICGAGIESCRAGTWAFGVGVDVSGGGVLLEVVCCSPWLGVDEVSASGKDTINGASPAAGDDCAAVDDAADVASDATVSSIGLEIPVCAAVEVRVFVEGVVTSGLWIVACTDGNEAIVGTAYVVLSVCKFPVVLS